MRGAFRRKAPPTAFAKSRVELVYFETAPRSGATNALDICVTHVVLVRDDGMKQRLPAYHFALDEILRDCQARRVPVVRSSGGRWTWIGPDGRRVYVVR